MAVTVTVTTTFIANRRWDRTAGPHLTSASLRLGVRTDGSDLDWVTVVVTRGPRPEPKQRPRSPGRPAAAIGLGTRLCR